MRQESEFVVRNFEKKFGRPPNLKNPTTFNEKVTYKILYDRRPILIASRTSCRRATTSPSGSARSI